MARDDFTTTTARKLAERAGYMCSNPDSNCLTAGPSEKDAQLATKKGRACHICAASENGPRYDKHQTPDERRHMNNGIWLCANCSDLIDKNNGVDFTAPHLKMWKSKHEEMVRKLIRSNASPLALARKNTDETEMAQRLVDYMDGKGAFYVHPDFEVHNHVVLSLKDARKELTDMLSKIEVGHKLYDSIKMIRQTCQDYMNNTSITNSPTEIAANLAIMRKKLGIILKSIEQQYGVKMGANLKQLLPVA